MATRSIGIDELDGLEIDDDGKLYWRGKAVILERRLKLGGYQIFLASAATASAALSALHPLGSLSDGGSEHCRSA